MKTVTPDQVQRTMDDLEDAYNDTEEISQALTTGGGGPDLEREAEEAMYDGMSGEGGQTALERQFENFLSTASDNKEKKITEKSKPKVSELGEATATTTTTLNDILRTAPSAPNSDPYNEEPDDDFGDPYTSYKGIPSKFTQKSYVQDKRERTGDHYLNNKKQQQQQYARRTISGKRIISTRPPPRGRVKPSRGPGPMQRPQIYQRGTHPPGTILVNGRWKRQEEVPMYT